MACASANLPVGGFVGDFVWFGWFVYLSVGLFKPTDNRTQTTQQPQNPHQQLQPTGVEGAVGALEVVNQRGQPQG